MKTTIVTGLDERLVITTGDRVVTILREHLVPYSNPPRWRVDPEAGLCFLIQHARAVADAVVGQEPSKAEESK